ncbi:hypothetical protein MCEMAEM6B_02462 [Mycobacteriaceae bacterium]
MAPPTPHRGPPSGPPPPPPPPVAPYGAPGHSPAPYGPAPYGAHPDNRPANPPRPWRRWVGLAAALAATIALSATATYTLTRPAPREEATVPVSDPDATAARQQVCEVFETATKNQMSTGTIYIDGELNVPVVLRSINSAVALENALSPDVPADVAAATRTYITRTLDQTTAATAGEPVETRNQLTTARNDAWYELADLCGIPR